MNKNKILIFTILVIIIVIINSTVAITSHDNLETEYSVSVKTDFFYNPANKTVQLFNIDSKKIVFKKTDSSGKFTFRLGELIGDIKDFNTIRGYICLKDDKSYVQPDEVHLECEGYFFYFPLFEQPGIGKGLQIVFHNLRRELTREQGRSVFNVYGSDENLFFCSQYIYKVDSTLIFRDHQLIEYSNKTCNLMFVLNETQLPEGSYFLGLYLSDGPNQVLGVYSFYQKEIEIVNPLDVNANATINLSNLSCYFDNGSQIKTIDLIKPHEKLIESSVCLNKSDLDKTPQIIYAPITVLSHNSRYKSPWTDFFHP